MAKSKTVFFCQSCGAEHPKWTGKCNVCGEWNSLIEEIVAPAKKGKAHSRVVTTSKPTLIPDIPAELVARIKSPYEEFNRILGGGLVPGSVLLLGGEPGIGKSTLALQLALKLKDLRILYISGEESLQQIKIRAERLGSNNSECYILSETSLENIFSHVENLKPRFIIIDSIQTLYTDLIDSSPGSVSQIKECAVALLRYAKENAVPIILIGHITKEGSIAGPKVLEHIVDVVLQFEGDHNNLYRILRASKNRFGSTAELGIFEMGGTGLREVTNPSEILITHHDEDLPGIAISSTIEGIRPFLIETQALVSSAAYGMPQRSSTGFDLRRLNMILAVLEKKAGFKLAAKDVFLNIAGGIKVYDTAIDLAIVCAILSSSADISIPQKYCFAGEVGLSGEIRQVSRVENRISEAEKLGFSKIFTSGSPKNIKHYSNAKIEVVNVNKIEKLFKHLFD